jgi:hypothetical protein
MSGPYPRPFTYEESVAIMAESIGEDFSSVKGVAIATAAFALSLAYNKSVADVALALKEQLHG